MRTIPLHGKIAAGRVALVDDADYDLVMQYRWHVAEVQRTGRPYGPYARTKPQNSKGLFMHTLITGFRQVDHRDGNGLNNQRSNLRDATTAQNAANRGHRSDARSSAYKGVNLVGGTRWRAQIASGGRKVHLGYFADEISAARAYDAAAREACGEFARLNFPD